MTIDPELIAKAGELIRSGRLVAFPTETVYGLGANALDPAAVARIYEAKKRPSTSPLIVHVDCVDMAKTLAAEWPDAAEALTKRFWPGPLTLVMNKRREVPSNVTAGLPTVGIRMPAHPIAQALILAAGVPIAAPSANPFTKLSPTTAEQVRATLGHAVELVLDGGPSAIGIESTVLSIADSSPVLLRPGMISREELESVVGPVLMPGGGIGEDEPHPSPGMHEQHYSPSTPLMIGEPPPGSKSVYLWREQPSSATPHNYKMPKDASSYAAILYDTLYKLDRDGWDWIAVEAVPADSLWAGIADRLERASGRRLQ